jgi:hypothetical protein
MSQVYYNHTTKQTPVKMGLATPATIALKRDGNDFVYGVTICSKYDSFSKKLGREMAEARLNQGFRRTTIPVELLSLETELGEKQMCLAFLYQLSASVTANSRKWKKKVTRFNIDNRNSGKVVAMYPEVSQNQQPRA